MEIKTTQTQTKQIQLIGPDNQVVLPDSEEGQQLIADLKAYIEANTEYVFIQWSMRPDQKMRQEWTQQFLQERGYFHREVDVSPELESPNVEALEQIPVPSAQSSEVEGAINRLRTLFKR